jgi:hypothetical protein
MMNVVWTDRNGEIPKEAGRGVDEVGRKRRALCDLGVTPAS